MLFKSKGTAAKGETSESKHYAKCVRRPISLTTRYRGVWYARKHKVEDTSDEQRVSTESVKKHRLRW